LGVFAVTGPLTARYIREILGATLGDAGAAGLPIPEPTYVDAYLQWTKNLGDLVLFLVVVLLAGVVAGECRAGTAVLVLTKPLPRAAFVLTKAATHAVVLAVAVAVGTALTWVVTRLLFPAAPVGRWPRRSRPGWPSAACTWPSWSSPPPA
jgi:ABC-2 type transport system permease protein